MVVVKMKKQNVLKVALLKENLNLNIDTIHLNVNSLKEGHKTFIKNNKLILKA